MVSESDLALAEVVGHYYDDPLGFVEDCFPWGEGELANETGPDDWQREALTELGNQIRERGFNGQDPVDPIRDATASGHGIGKSTYVAWLVMFLMSTRPYAKVTVTANTFTQLQTKTWASIQTWKKRCITGHWFTCTGDLLYHNDYKESWYCSAQSSKEENSEAFAGQHNRNSTSAYLFDEASAIPDKIFEVAEGGLTDGEPMIFMFGNPTRNTGKLYRVCFGNEQHRWRHRSIDARLSKISNKKLLQEWLDDYGEDSDFFRIRARGLPPRASELQFIDNERIQLSQKRKVEVLEDEPLVCGVDVSGGGSAWTVFRFRRGLDGRVKAPIRVNGERSRDRSMLIGIGAELLADRRPGHRISAMFVDSAFGAALCERWKTMGFTNVHEVSFGAASPDPHQANFRAYMYNKGKDWLLQGALPDEELLATQLGLPGYHINRQNKLVIESKADLQKRGESSPDDGDAFVLTFARHVSPEGADQDTSWKPAPPPAGRSWAG